MDQTAAQGSLFSDRVLVDGKWTLLTFHSDGTLRWSDENGKSTTLLLHKHLLGVSVQGSTIFLKCAVVSASRFLQLDSTATLVRKSFLIDPPSGKSELTDLHQELLLYLDSLSGIRLSIIYTMHPSVVFYFSLFDFVCFGQKE